MKETLQHLRNRNFALLWAGQTVSALGDWILLAALPVWVYQITGSGTALGAMVFFETLPLLVVGPVAGVFVDRWDLRRVMLATDILRGLTVLLLLLARTPQTIFLVFGVGFVESSLSSLFRPAREAALPGIVIEEQLLSANSLFQSAIFLMRLLGPAIGGALVGTAGAGPAFVLDALTFFVSALAITAMRLPPMKRSGGDGSPSTGPFDGLRTPLRTGVAGVYRELAAGLRVIRDNRVLSSVLVVWCLLMFSAGAIVALLVVFVEEALHAPGSYYGYLLSLQGLGMLVGAVATGSLGDRYRPTNLFKVGLLIFGPLFLAAANAPNVAWAGGLVFLMGITMSGIAIADQTIFQQQAPETYRGRILSGNDAATALATLVGVALAGVVADQVGIRLIFDGAAMLSILAALVAVVLLRGSQEQPDAHEVAPLKGEVS
jgi:MFS family permease